MRLNSTVFADGSAIPRRFTCDGEDLSPDTKRIPVGNPKPIRKPAEARTRTQNPARTKRSAPSRSTRSGGSQNGNANR
jgi:hypothetical protein